MKRFVLLLRMLLLMPGFAFAQNDGDVNVLSYYAVGNSLDGQILINTVNVLRFYPVFAARTSTDTVRVTVYYGPNTFTRLASKMENGRYWQVLLPPFHLGEAIQRLEVETHIKIDPTYNLQMRLGEARAELLKNAVSQFTASVSHVQSGVATMVTSLDNLKSTLTDGTVKLSNLNGQFDTVGKTVCSSYADLKRYLDANVVGRLNVLPQTSDSSYADQLNLLRSAVAAMVDSIASIHRPLEDQSSAMNKLIDNVTATVLAIDALPGVTKSRDTLKQSLYVFIQEQEKLMFAFRDSIISQITGKVNDTNYLGIGIRSSDVVLDEGLEGAKILYRNYKSGLRQLPALDPAEKLGIFRIRYIPFAVVGGKLRGPFGSHSNSTRPPVGMFEVGLGFGDVAVPGDDFVKPELSIRRLGVSFVITEKLFNADAQILALALTYDFNSYGSIGAGANFAPLRDTKSPESYFSFGINKLAFEALLGEFQKLFR